MGAPAAFEPETTSIFTIRPDPSAQGERFGVTHVLSWTDDTGQFRHIPIDRDVFVVGRTPPADIVLAGAMVSRRHCQVAVADSALILTDLGSTNGTFMDGARIAEPVALVDGCTVSVGPYQLRYGRRDAREAREAQALERDLAAAGQYVASILPPPLLDGPVRAEWAYEPSARLGGDAFGYQMLDDRHFALFLLDVTGHGAGAALHAVSVANALRQRLLPAVDFRDPGAVIGALNRAFPMETHNDLMFTIWYGVLNLADRVLTYAAAGHHPAYLAAPAAAEPAPLVTRNPAIGMVAGRDAATASVTLPPAAALMVFSDGVFEVTGRDDRTWTLADLLGLLPLAAAAGGPDRLRRRLRDLIQPGPMEDDFSFLTIIIP